MIGRSNSAIAAAGALDPTFGTGGKVTALFSGNSAIPVDVALQTDGKVLVASGFDNATIATEAFVVVRYNTNGDIEVKATRFNIDGAVDGTFLNPPFNFGVPSGSTNSFVQGIGFQANGQILLGGGFTTGTNEVFGLARLNADGTLDSGFGSGGTVTTSFMNCDFINAIAVQSNGDIVAIGQTLDKSTGIAELVLACYLGN